MQTVLSTKTIYIGHYLPPQASTEAALLYLCKDLNFSQTSNPDAALIVAGDFNQVNLKKGMCFINTLTVPQGE